MPALFFCLAGLRRWVTSCYMHILIGTLYTIENEFEECVAAIKRQTFQDFEHLVIRDLPNKEAHDTLYQTFMDRANEFNLLIKVDADMVIPDEELFAKIVQKFRSHVWMDRLQIDVFDYFTDRLIPGLNTYRNSWEWKQRGESLFTDVFPVPKERKMVDRSELVPAALHCKNPSPFQAFHFGMHNGVKVRGAIERKWFGAVATHWGNIRLTWKHFLRISDVRLGLAVLGGELALRGEFLTEHLDYSNPFALEAFRQYEGCSAEQLQRMVRRLRWSNLGFLPSRARREAMGVRDGGIRYGLRRIADGLRTHKIRL